MQTNRQKKPACDEETLVGGRTQQGVMINGQRHNKCQRGLAERMACHLTGKNEGTLASLTVAGAMMMVTGIRTVPIGTLFMVGQILTTEGSVGGSFTRMAVMRAATHQNVGGKCRDRQNSPQ